MRFFDTTDVDSLADRLSNELIRRVPPSRIALEGAKDRARVAKTTDSILREVRTFTQNNKLNFYKKARLANRFKWALRDAGYDAQFVDSIALDLATLMATTRR